MPNASIKLGDEVEDITAKIAGIAVGRIEYLDGSLTWIIQPPSDPDGHRRSTIEVSDAYIKRLGPGVAVSSKQPLGFNARIGG